MSEQKVRERPRSDTRERILNVGEELIAQYGMEGFQLKDVAERIGIRPPSIFAHFAGRDAIANAIAERMLLRLRDLLVAGDDEDPAEVTVRWVRGLVSYMMANTAHLRIFLRDMAHAGSPGVNEYENGYIQDEMGVNVGKVLQRGIEKGIFRPVRVEGLMAIVFGAVVTALVWDGWDDAGNPLPGVPIETVQDEIEDLVKTYLAPRP
jgi:AcrR family transcriptional regulator